MRDHSDAVAPHSEVGGWRLAVGGWRLAVGGWRLAVGGDVNFMDDDDATPLHANYGTNVDRLVKVKRQCDPDNFFRVNQNIAH